MTVYGYGSFPCTKKNKVSEALQVHCLTKLDSLGQGKLFTEVYCAEERNNNTISCKGSNIPPLKV